MPKKRFAALNTLLAVAGVAFLFFFLTARNAPANRETPQIQMVEQERMAETYFRVLSFLSEIMPKPSAVRPRPEPTKRDPIASPATIELCRYWTGHDQTVDRCNALHKRS
jgi:hypothetical protein